MIKKSKVISRSPAWKGYLTKKQVWEEMNPIWNLREMYSQALQAQKRKLGLKILKSGDLCYRDGNTKMPSVPPHP